MFRFGAASNDELERILNVARRAEPTYGAQGETAEPEFPVGFRHDRTERCIGASSAFERAREGLWAWQAHAGMGAQIYPDLEISAGKSVLVIVRFGPVQVIAPCRIIYVVDEADRFGFAYGTLPGHPETGEESFIVERDGEDTMFRIAAFSRPAEFLTRLGGPISRQVQVRANRKYLDGLEAYVRAGSTP